MKRHWFSAELRRLRDCEKEFGSDEEYSNYVRETLKTLIKADVISNFYLQFRGTKITLISVQVPKTCYDTVNIDFNLSKE